MSILAGAKLKNSKDGYAKDFINHIVPLLRKIKQKKIKVISNAGGVNLDACKKALNEAAKQKNKNLKIATEVGEYLIDCQDMLRKLNVLEMDSAQSFPENLLSIYVYLGANPINWALDLGADIVLTGRCVDSALALGP